MRWRFLDPDRPADAHARRNTIWRIDAWWKEFEAKTDEIESLFTRDAEWDLPEWMATHLQAVHPQLMWEYGPAVRGNGRRLVITPESARHVRPLTATLLERAPQISGWEFYGYRLQEDVVSAHAVVEGRVNRDISEYQVSAKRGSSQRIDLCFFSSSIADESDRIASHAAFLATESLLGEEVLDKWIGAIEVARLPKPSKVSQLFGRSAERVPHLISLERLQPTVKALIDSIGEQLPPRPYYECAANDEWTLWELSPNAADDYCSQDDLYIASSANRSMWSAGHDGGLFYSERFSRCGEIFCYVKFDAHGKSPNEQLVQRRSLEEALNQFLVEEKIGCQVGGGTGLRYSYIDLALVDLERAIRAVQERLQAANAPKRSWIQFYDADLVGEWIGVFPETPPPPMQVFDR